MGLRNNMSKVRMINAILAVNYIVLLIAFIALGKNVHFITPAIVIAINIGVVYTVSFIRRPGSSKSVLNYNGVITPFYIPKRSDFESPDEGH
jgi:hypothetical protein